MINLSTKKWWPLLCLAVTFSQTSFAQTMGNKGHKRIPPFNWVDNTHFTMTRDTSKNYMMGVTVLVDAKSNTEVILERPARNQQQPVAMFTRKNEIVFADKSKAAIQHVTTPMFSPDSTKIAFTRNHDLYVVDVASGKETRITSDGSADVYSGYASWVYNEEILGRGMNYRAFWWSPNSKHIAFFRSDETKVPVYNMRDEMPVHAKDDLTHYPQPGDPNPEVKVGIVDLATNHVVFADYDAKADQYFGAPYWEPNSQTLWVQWMNRRQDSLKIDAINLANGTKTNIYTEHQRTWISLDEENRITFLKNTPRFILKSDKSGWMHYYLGTNNGKTLVPITSGDWQVEDIQYINEKTNTLFFTARKENSTRIDLYSVQLDGSKLKRLTFGDFTHFVKLSPGGDYFITAYGNVSTPTVAALYTTNGKFIRQIADSKTEFFAEYKGPKYEILRIKTGDGFDLPVSIKWPVNYDAAKKYPVYVRIYGGPNSKNVNDGYANIYDNGEVEAEPFIQISMDHRGSGHFGKKGMDYLYGDLGHWEIADYSFVVKELLKKYPSLDGSRVLISGFSYGGYLTCMALTRGADVFTHGLAGGSVTDWRLYDSHYTERYMGLPKDNEAGYNASSVFTYVKNFKGKLRLAQGLADDNVHAQNTFQLMNAFQEAGKEFEVMLYPGAAHGWYYLHNKQKHYMADNEAFISKYIFGKDK